MKVNLEQLEEMKKELFRQQCDLDIHKAMVKHFIKEKQAEQLNLTDVSQQRELLIAFDTMRQFDIKHDDIEESIDYFLKHKESYL
jgi:hypothetical protein